MVALPRGAAGCDIADLSTQRRSVSREGQTGSGEGSPEPSPPKRERARGVVDEDRREVGLGEAGRAEEVAEAREQPVEPGAASVAAPQGGTCPVGPEHDLSRELGDQVRGEAQ